MSAPSELPTAGRPGNFSVSLTRHFDLRQYWQSLMAMSGVNGTARYVP
ncbi:hypothetical protein [Streptomyces sp. NPDC058385]